VKIVSLFTLITWDRFPKKEMVQAAGFEPRIIQLWVQDFDALAISL
jgi:hypothetical protein